MTKNTELAFDILHDVLDDFRVRGLEDQKRKFNEIAEEVISRARRQQIELDSLDVAELLKI